FNNVQSYLSTQGVRLQTDLPNSLCPQVNVTIEQPVKGPLFSKVSVPNGRSTAQRIIKNAIVVPVFNGVSIVSPPSTVNVTGTITTPPVNLNTTVLAPLQQSLLPVLDQVNANINKTLGAANSVVSSIPGTNVGQLDLLTCLRNTVADLYNPPTAAGSAVTSQQLLTQALQDAALSGDPVQVIQVGVQNCAGALSSLDIYSCVAPALGQGVSTLGKLTGLYDIPFLDVTPVIVKDVGNGNFQGVPVAATEANGAFRSVLVRADANDRFAP
ncbi:MAG: hypothetical protein JWM40_931, partial [Frankiales bacterium]|nr:hypothetical protein [Frankiales bacterium]